MPLDDFGYEVGIGKVYRGRLLSAGLCFSRKKDGEDIEAIEPVP
jgi:hypothetical protein